MVFYHLMTGKTKTSENWKQNLIYHNSKLMYKKGYLSWLQYCSLQKQTGLLVMIEFTVMIEFLLCPFGPIFPFYCINSLKNQVWKNEKNAWLYWCTPTTSWYDWCTVPEIKNATDMNLFHFVPFYALSLLPSSPNN